MVIQLSRYVCDLHTHSAASDGSDTPAEVAAMACGAGLAAFSLTDHDTVAGLSEASRAAEAEGIEFIGGIEFSVKASMGNMHILGYMIDAGCQEFQATLDMVQAARAARTPRLLKKLRELGLPVEEEELFSISRGGQLGRPHFARIMVEKGYVKDVSQAFSRYLRRGAPAYVPKSILSPEDAIRAIQAAGGLAVLAHPFSLMCRSRKELRGVLLGLCESGLDGMECYYSEHTPAFTRQCLDMCREFNIVATGGSDYHGRAKPYIKIGRGKGDLQVPYQCVKDLKARWDGKRDTGCRG